MNIDDVLLAMWPNGIPTQDYAKVLRLMRLETRRATPQASREAVGQIAALLATGPATAEELQKATGLRMGTVYAALRAMGAPAVGRIPRPNGNPGRGRTVYGTPVAKDRTPGA